MYPLEYRRLRSLGHQLHQSPDRCCLDCHMVSRCNPGMLSHHPAHRSRHKQLRQALHRSRGRRLPDRSAQTSIRFRRTHIRHTVVCKVEDITANCAWRNTVKGTIALIHRMGATWALIRCGERIGWDTDTCGGWVTNCAGRLTGAVWIATRCFCIARISRAGVWTAGLNTSEPTRCRAEAHT